MSWVTAFGRFWYDFVIGDDWKIAAGVVLALGLAVAVMASGIAGDAVLAVMGGGFIVVSFVTSLVIDVHRNRSG